MTVGLTILLVEDDRDVADAVTDVLTDVGLLVVHAENGLEALELLEGGLKPAMILLDLMMPRMTGEQFREAQLNDPRIAAIPVVMLSAHRALKQTAQRLAVNAFLLKPVTPGELLRTVQAVVGGTL